MPELDDTIGAIATAAGEGGIGIVRVSGPRASAVAEALLRGGDGEPRRLRGGRVRWARVLDPRTGQTMDEVLALWMPGPASYTREDVLELQCHGGQAAVRGVLDAVLACGVRLAEPGEFTLRAYLRGRIDLVQAEAVLDVIRAQTADVLRVHEGLLEGGLSREVGAWQESLGRVLATVEAHLDFPEEDLGALDVESLAGRLEGVCAGMEEKLGSYAWGRVTREGFRVALVGSPNTGKSSLLNCLAEEDCAIVSPVPGTTRDAIEVCINACGAPVRVVDTAGLRGAGDEVEKEGVRRARRAAEGSDLVLFVTDGGRALWAEEEEEAASLAKTGRAWPVVNKVDLGRFPESRLGELFARRPLAVSARTGEGVGELLEVLRDAAWGGRGPSVSAPLTRVRHRRAVEAATELVARAVDVLRREEYLEVVASELHAARRHLAELLGWGAPEDVLEAIFSEFCIGK
jgi:tRNA modification GTPase